MLTQEELAWDNIWRLVCERSREGCICGYHMGDRRDATDAEVRLVQKMFEEAQR